MYQILWSLDVWVGSMVEDVYTNFYCFGHLGFLPSDQVGKFEPVIKIIAFVFGWLWLQMDKICNFFAFLPFPPFPPTPER